MFQLLNPKSPNLADQVKAAREAAYERINARPVTTADIAKLIGTGVAGGAAGMGAAEGVRRALDSDMLAELLSQYNPRGPR